MQVRNALPEDVSRLAKLRVELWPNTSREEHETEARAILAGAPRSTLPLVVFVAEEAGELLGFAEVGLRSHANGCDSRRAVGFLEGWYVVPAMQRRGIGRALICAAEEWCAKQGCVEMASDSRLENSAALLAHEGVGFEVVETCVNYRKLLRDSA